MIYMRKMANNLLEHFRNSMPGHKDTLGLFLDLEKLRVVWLGEGQITNTFSFTNPGIAADLHTAADLNPSKAAINLNLSLLSLGWKKVQMLSMADGLNFKQQMKDLQLQTTQWATAWANLIWGNCQAQANIEFHHCNSAADFELWWGKVSQKDKKKKLKKLVMGGCWVGVCCNFFLVPFFL